MAQTRGPWLSTATALFFSWALLSFCVRIYVNLGRKQRWGQAETALSAAFTVALLHVAANFWAISHEYGLPLLEITETQLGDVEKALFASQISYIVSIGLTRISTAFFIEHFTRRAPHPHTRVSYGLAVVSVVWTVACTLVIALRGDLARPWAMMDNAEALYHRWIAIEATGLAIEAALWAFSVTLIWGLQLKARKRALILSIFGCRLLLIPIVAIRLYYLSPDRNDSPTLTNIIPHILTEAALDCALVATSVPALKPFLRPLRTGAVLDTVGGSGYGHNSGPRSQAQGMYMLSSIASDKKENVEVTSTVTSNNGINVTQLRPEVRADNNEREVESSSEGDVHRDDLESVKSNSSEQMIIRTTRDWSVRYEDK